MANYQFKTRETIKSKLDLIPISVGQMITCSDTGELYFDTAYDGRICISDFIILNTDEEILNLENPIIGKLYLSKETNFIYRYDENWIQLTYPKVEIVRGTIIDTTETYTIKFDDNFNNNFNPNTDTVFIYINGTLLIDANYYLISLYNSETKLYDNGFGIGLDGQEFLGSEKSPTIIHYIIYKNTGNTIVKEEAR